MSAPTRAKGKPFYGELPDYPPGSWFRDRNAAQQAGVHRPGQAGICGTKKLGAESIVVSGGYEDDEDLGDLIIYTGHGGNDPRTKRQIADQTFDDSGNAALLTSSHTGTLVRVIRGAHKGSAYAPPTGYRYDGLYRVVDAWQERGRSTFLICRYKFIKDSAEILDENDVSIDVPAPSGTTNPDRQQSVVQRVVRSTEVSRHVKRLHNHICQVCNTRLVIAGLGYSEGAHIRPLGRPHNGPDIPSNVLCLCPNCHVLFDKGALIIDDTMQVWLNGERLGLLTIDSRHAISEEYVTYHRDHFGFS